MHACSTSLDAANTESLLEWTESESSTSASKILWKYQEKDRGKDPPKIMSDTPAPTMTASEMAANSSPPPVTKPASGMTPVMERVDADEELAAAGPPTPTPVKKIRLVGQTRSPKSKDADADSASDQFHLLMDPKSIVGDIDLRVSRPLVLGGLRPRLTAGPWAHGTAGRSEPGRLGASQSRGAKGNRGFVAGPGRGRRGQGDAPV